MIAPNQSTVHATSLQPALCGSCSPSFSLSYTRPKSPPPHITSRLPTHTYTHNSAYVFFVYPTPIGRALVSDRQVAQLPYVPCHTAHANGHGGDNTTKHGQQRPAPPSLFVVIVKAHAHHSGP